MASETVASDQTSTTDEQIVKKEKSEAIAQMIASLANEDEVKHDNPEDAQGHATPSSKIEGETKGDETKAELAVVNVEKSDDSPALEASVEDNLKHDKVEDAQTPAAPFSKTEGEAEEDDKKAKPAAVVVEKTDDPVSLEAYVADNLKEEQELIPHSQTIIVAEPSHDAAKSQPEEPPSTEATVEETPQQLEKESTKTEEEKQSKTADIPEASAETIEKSRNTAEANPLTEPESEVAKEAEILETSAQKEEKPEPEPEPVATEVQEKTKEPEKESQEKPQEAEQPSTVAIPEPSAEANEKPSDSIEEKTREPSAEVLKETNYQAGPAETVKAEPVVSEVEENPKEPEKQSFKQKEEEQEQPNTVVIPEVPSAETSEAIEEKTREPEFEAEVLTETDNYEAGPTETEKVEPVVTKVDENPSEPEKQSFKQEDEKQTKRVIPETAAESVEKPGDTVEVHPSKESDIEVVKEIGKSESEAVPEKTEKPGDIVVVHPPKESDIDVVKETGNSESEAVPGKAEKPDDIVVVHPPEESDIEVVKETGTSELEAVPEKVEKPDDIVVVHPPDESDIEVVKETGTSELEAVPEKVEKPDDIVVVHPPEESDIDVVKETGNSESEAVLGKAEKPDDIVVVHPPEESDIEVVKETGTSELEAVPEKVEKPDDIVVVHPAEESDIDVVKETGNSESEAVPGKAEKPDDIVVVHPPEESDIEVVKETGTRELEAVPEKVEKPEPVSTEVEEKPREKLEVAEEVGETSKDVETKQENVLETTKSSDETIKDPISLKEEKTDREEETSITGNTAQVSLNEEAQAAPTNLVEPSPGVAEKVVEEDGKKESSITDVIEGVSKEEAGVIKNPEQVSIDQEAKTGLKEEREYSAPTNVVEKVAAAAIDEKKETEAPDAVQVSSREEEVEIKKVEEQNEAKTATTEAGVVKAESVKDDRPTVDNEKGGHPDTKVDEISSAVSEPLRETLASKFEEEESTKTGADNLEKEQTQEPVKTEVQVPEPPTKESDATKTSKDLPKETPAKPAQKQSNNIISKVKQSLVKAKKAITGKSPSSKNPSSEAKGDIKVK